MALSGYCGKRRCSGCPDICRLDEQIPCSPDCENLMEDGKIKIGQCLKEKCEGAKYIFGMPDTTKIMME